VIGSIHCFHGFSLPIALFIDWTRLLVFVPVIQVSYLRFIRCVAGNYVCVFACGTPTETSITGLHSVFFLWLVHGPSGLNYPYSPFINKVCMHGVSHWPGIASQNGPTGYSFAFQMSIVGRQGRTTFIVCGIHTTRELVLPVCSTHHLITYIWLIFPRNGSAKLWTSAVINRQS
jgi:hypothetical protein